MEKQIGKLVFVRHGESEWNCVDKWTGITDVHLSPKGCKESEKIGELIKDIHLDHIFTSTLSRTKETLTSMTKCYGSLCDVPTEECSAIIERDYGDYTGKNKWEVEKEVGVEEFQKLRRGWDYPVPNGENLKQVYERTYPFFMDKILPILNENKNVLVVAHGNSIRALVKYIENISDADIPLLEIPFGEIWIYDLNGDGHMVKKEVRKIN